ncbi:hypothetical protein YSA_05360 [Pseudomonas putida ND6]|uniref:Uncharacterized protein n=1 Tax=Pseudomonas putida ND6 TaxID=231023 RepID=I3UVZ1_PSEPU|nr:hypothetical protein YSA_05360 [Pseudomonas putida ND6]
MSTVIISDLFCQQPSMLLGCTGYLPVESEMGDGQNC